MSGYLNGQRLRPLTLIGLSAGGSILVALGLWLWLPTKAVSALVAALMAVWIWGSVWVHARAWARTTHVTHGRAPIGTWLAHVGFGVLLIGMVLASVMETWREVRMQPGDSVHFEGQRVTFTGLESVTGPNYLATRALIEFKSADGKVRRLTPERRTYIGQTMPVSEVAIDSSWSRDLYVSLGERVPGQADTAWSVRLQSTPFIRAIWGGALLMALGGLIALWQKYARIVVPIRPGTQRHGESE
jgi:cytochrome c-type biogenesis protein CcmF